ncbi:FAD/NAD-P-binding domain-containing protein [Dentipellis sp. KUC8613]|nr:FAD/NAD-P-binding domain-containing protein [Dentipellis sp. KUC8613]
MTSPKFRVAICGGGIGGLTLAATLGKYGDIPVDIYESATEIGTIGAGLLVWKRTWEVMQQLGLQAEMDKRNIPIPREGKAPILTCRRADTPVEGKDLFHLVAPYTAIPLHRMHLVDILKSALPDNCTIHTSKRLMFYTHTGDYTTMLHFDDGSTAATNVLIGADGIRSVVRTQLGAEVQKSGRLPQELQSPAALQKAIEPKWTGTIIYRSLIKPTKVRADHPLWTSAGFCYSGKMKHIIVYPISNGAFINFLAFYTVPDGEGTPYEGKWMRDAPKEEVLDAFQGWEPDVREVLDALDPVVSRWALHTMGFVPFAGEGRVAILGDSMHAMTTHLGAGAGQAMEDSYLLGRLLSHPSTTLSNVPAVMQIYEDLRLAPANQTVALSRELGLMYELNGPVYNGEEPVDEDVLRRWKEEIYKRWEVYWQGRPEDDWKIAEGRLQHVTKHT